MLISVVTPTHDPAWLARAWQTLVNQVYPHWEWLLVPNGPRAQQIGELALRISQDNPKLQIRAYPSDPKGNVGALKRFGFSQAAGQLLVELDHDDELTPDCLTALKTAYDDAGQESAFLFSDAITLQGDGQCVNYNQRFGWQHYDWQREDGKHFRVNRQFPVHPRSLCEILYAPDHVRAWSRAAYAAAGGHSSELPVGDDHELIVRTWLAGAAFLHLPRPLYYHHLRGDNTSQQRVQEIGVQSEQTRDKYLGPLIQEWCRREALPLYDLGYGPGRPRTPGYEYLNLQEPLDWIAFREQAESSVGSYRLVDVLQFLPNQEATDLLELVYQRLAPGGWLQTLTPAIADEDGKVGLGAFADPRIRSYWSRQNWKYYTERTYAEQAGLRCRFQLVRLRQDYPTDAHRYSQTPYIRADLAALKDENPQPWPAPVLI